MRAPWIIILFVAAAGCFWTDKASHPNTYRGIALQTYGPRGGGFINANGKVLGYWIYRVHVMNDTTVPVELAMDFPGGPIAMLPDSEKYPTAFLFPDEITPDTAQDVLNFGIKGSEAFLSTRSSGPTSLRTTVLPGEDHLLYIGVVLAPDGVGRAELFSDGQKPNASFFPEGSVPTSTKKGNELDLIFGIAIDAPKHYAMVPCGRITFKK
ncbi:MAG: hypothetical protein KA352_15630 [Flavobacteriales bacterium]|nr:hypothetical protein [Flavobacteriales bacterium]